MTKVMVANDKAFIAVDSEIVPLGPVGGYGDRPTPVGYCRMIDGTPCGCQVAWVLDNGNCPCARNDASNPVCKAPQVATGDMQ